MQTYYAKSLFETKTFWVNLAGAVIAILQATEFQSLLTAGGLKYTALAITVINIILRTWTERPAVVMMPGKVRPVKVHTLRKEA